MSILATPFHRTAPLAAAIALALVAAACGSDEPVESQLPEPVVTAAAEPSSTTPNDTDSADTDAAADATVIGTANMGGVVVDPKLHPIDDLAIAESYPEQLQITFTGGDANCTAADARAVVDGNTIRVELEVGITEDALTKSCLAGEFEHSLSIALSEGLDGRTVSIEV